MELQISSLKGYDMSELYEKLEVLFLADINRQLKPSVINPVGKILCYGVTLRFDGYPNNPKFMFHAKCNIGCGHCLDVTLRNDILAREVFDMYLKEA
tara:strand:- start:1 stop:291 length:291 start_codon:yes stop_codon:yes gene_type:complete